MSSFVDSGFGCEANSSNFAESLAVLASSTGPKTFRFSAALLALIVLALAPLAMVKLETISV